VTKPASQDAGGTTAAAAGNTHGGLAFLLMQGPAKRPVRHFQSEAHMLVL
jgi:hypothetical protein